MLLTSRQVYFTLLRIMLLTTLSCFLGAWQDIWQAHFLGIGALSDAFITATRLGNLLRGVLADSKIAALLVPQLVTYRNNNQPNKSAQLLALALVGILLPLSIVCILIICWPNLAIKFFVPGITDQLRIEYLHYFIPRLFPLLLTLALAAILTSALKSVNVFWPTALGPSVLHLSILLGLWGIAQNWWSLWSLVGFYWLGAGLKILLRAIGCYQNGITIQPFWNQPNNELYSQVGNILHKAGPLAANSLVTQLIMTWQIWLGSFLPTGQISLFHYAYRFYHLPYLIILLPLTNVFLPHFANLIAQKQNHLIGWWTKRIVLIALAVTIPLIAILAYWHQPLLILVLGKNLSLTQQQQAGSLFLALLPGLPMEILNHFYTTLFYARQNTITPAKVQMFSFAGYLIFNSLGLYFAGAIGIALTNSLLQLLVFFSWLYLDKQYNQTTANKFE